MNDLGRIRRGQIDLVDDRQHLEPLLQGRIAIGNALRLDTLGRVDHQERSLAGRERARHFVGEIHMTGRIDEIQLIDLAGDRFERERDALRFDGNAPLPLQIHRVEHLSLHLPRIETAAFLDESIRQSRFAMINMSNDGKVADILHLGLGGDKPSIIPVGDGKRGPYVLPRRPNARDTPIHPRTATPESYGRSALLRRARHRRRAHRWETAGLRATRQVRSTSPRTGRSRRASTGGSAASRRAWVRSASVSGAEARRCRWL